MGARRRSAQQPLSYAYELVTPDRPGYAIAGPDAPDDPEADAVDIGKLLGEGAHLVGFSMGGMAAMLAAARKPAAVRSLVAGHAVQFTGQPFNTLLETIWRAATSQP